MKAQDVPRAQLYLWRGHKEGLTSYDDIIEPPFEIKSDTPLERRAEKVFFIGTRFGDNTVVWVGVNLFPVESKYLYFCNAHKVSNAYYCRAFGNAKQRIEALLAKGPGKGFEYPLSKAELERIRLWYKARELYTHRKKKQKEFENF